MKAEIGAQRLADKTDLDEDAKDSSEVHSNSILKYIYIYVGVEPDCVFGDSYMLLLLCIIIFWWVYMAMRSDGLGFERDL